MIDSRTAWVSWVSCASSPVSLIFRVKVQHVAVCLFVPDGKARNDRALNDMRTL